MTKEFIVGSSGAGSQMETMPLMINRIFGTKMKVISGYKDGTSVFLAMQRGEVQMHNTSIGTFRTRNADFIKSGQGIAIAYLGGIDADGKYAKSATAPDLLALPELYREIYGALPTGIEWETMGWLSKLFTDMAFIGLAPPKTPEPALDALRKGFLAAITDPEFVALAVKANGVPYDPVSTEQATAIINSLANVKPEVLATAKKWLDGFGK